MECGSAAVAWIMFGMMTVVAWLAVATICLVCTGK